MKKKILTLLERSIPQLVFALLSGLAYFAVIYDMIIVQSQVGGGLIVFFFCPAIVCGTALVLIKLFKQCRENEKENTIVTVFSLHVLLMIIAAAMTAAAIMR